MIRKDKKDIMLIKKMFSLCKAVGHTCLWGRNQHPKRDTDVRAMILSEW